MIRVCLSGARGRMGRRLAQLILESDDLELAAAVEAPGHPELGLELDPQRAPGVVLSDDVTQALEPAEVLLDFSLPQSVCTHAETAAQAGCAVVTGTTGLSAEQRQVLDDSAAKVAVVLGSNMSRGVHLLSELVRTAAQLLGSEYDVEISEVHHRNKVDSPSGTALQLAEAVRSVRGGQIVYAREGKRQAGDIGVSALRGGDVVGEHEVSLYGPGERISLAHRATTREHFCRGALDAVRFVVGRRAGLYSMDDVFSAGR